MVAARHGSVVWTSTSAAALRLRLPALAPALSTTTASCLPSSPPHTVPHTPRRPLPSLQYLRDETHVSACAGGRDPSHPCRGRETKPLRLYPPPAAGAGNISKAVAPYRPASRLRPTPHHFPSPPTSKPPQPFMAITTTMCRRHSTSTSHPLLSPHH
jgi:hypothetical protein